MTMNPLANTDLQTYLRNLVDRHMPDKDGHGKGWAPHPKALHEPSDNGGARSTEEKETRTEKV
jgi:hypothetical protein